MKKINVMLVGAILAIATPATAGGILTNTNQSIDFLRNPARDAAIGLDGVYSNPAGVAFLPEGFYLEDSFEPDYDGIVMDEDGNIMEGYR